MSEILLCGGGPLAAELDEPVIDAAEINAVSRVEDDSTVIASAYQDVLNPRQIVSHGRRGGNVEVDSLWNWPGMALVRPLLGGVQQHLHRRHRTVRDKYLGILSCAAFVLGLLAIPAEAQRRHHGDGGGRVTVIHHSPLLWGGGFYGGLHSPYYTGFGPWYPYPGPIFGFPPGIYQDAAVALRLQVTPREAQVYVDGFAAGVVDDYDGVFQRLRLIPGPHEIAIYHPGHRTLRQSIYYNPGSTHTIRHALEPLPAGESPEPQPVPRQLPAYPGMTGQPAVRDSRIPDNARVGTLALRVQPGDATVLVDGEPWRGPQTQDRLVIQLDEGSHRVRIEKPGFQTFVVDVDVRAGETTGFNVSLLSQ